MVEFSMLVGWELVVMAWVISEKGLFYFTFPGTAGPCVLLD